MQTRLVGAAVTLVIGCASGVLAQPPEVLKKLAGRYEGTLAPAPTRRPSGAVTGRVLIINETGQGYYGTTKEKPYRVDLEISTSGSAVYVSFTTGANSRVQLELVGDSLVGVLTPQGGGTGRNLTLTRAPG